MRKPKLGQVYSVGVDGQTRWVQQRGETLVSGIRWYRIIHQSETEDVASALTGPELFNQMIVDHPRSLAELGIDDLGVFDLPGISTGPPRHRTKKGRYGRGGKGYIDEGWVIRNSIGDKRHVDELSDEERDLDLGLSISWPMLPALLRSGWTPSQFPAWGLQAAIDAHKEN